MDYQALNTLIKTHPSWPSVTDEDLVIWVNDPTAMTLDRESLPNEKILATILSSATTRAEFAALSDTDKAKRSNLRAVSMPNGKFKIGVRNRCNVALAASGNTIKFRRHQFASS